MSGAKRIDHVGVNVEELTEPTAFLQRLGFTVEQQILVPDRVQASVLSCGGLALELVRRISPDPQGGQGFHVGVEVEDLDGFVAVLRAEGVQTTSPTPSTGGPNRSYFTLPQTSRGIPLQFFERA